MVGHSTDAEIMAIAQVSPQVALLALTGELEAATSRLLARRPKWRTKGFVEDTRRLVRAEILPPTAFEAVRQFAQVRNRIAHGDPSAKDALVLATVELGLSILGTVKLVESNPTPGPSFRWEGS